mgnify:CR=1 FL=1
MSDIMKEFNVLVEEVEATFKASPLPRTGFKFRGPAFRKGDNVWRVLIETWYTYKGERQSRCEINFYSRQGGEYLVWKDGELFEGYIRRPTDAMYPPIPPETLCRRTFKQLRRWLKYVFPRISHAYKSVLKMLRAIEEHPQLSRLPREIEYKYRWGCDTVRLTFKQKHHDIVLDIDIGKYILGRKDVAVVCTEHGMVTHNYANVLGRKSHLLPKLLPIIQSAITRVLNELNKLTDVPVSSPSEEKVDGAGDTSPSVSDKPGGDEAAASTFQSRLSAGNH